MKQVFTFLAVLFLQFSALAQTTESQVEKHMDFLASDELQGRNTGTEGIEKAADYIISNFKSSNVKPFFTTYKDTLSNINVLGYNIVGYVEGNDEELKDEVILLGAHYDHIGFGKPQEKDTIANGANDNASGTTAVLEMAKYFGKHKSNKRSILFVLFSAEEMGLKGSQHLATKLKDENLNLYCMMNFEMIGIPMQQSYLTYLTGFEESNMAAKVNEYAGEELAGFLATAKEYNLFMRSDNYPFYKAFEVPAQTFSTFDFTNFDQYHQVGDEVEAMDMTHMVKVINSFIPVIEKIANTAEKEISFK